MSVAAFILVYGLSYGMVLFIISVGLAVTLGLMRVVNMAHGSFAALGGYLAVAMMTQWSVPFPVAVIVATLGTALISVPIERFLYVPIYEAGELDQVLLTIGLVFVSIAGLNLAFGPNQMPTSLPRWLSANVDIGPIEVQSYRLMIIVVGALLIAALWVVFDRTDFGARLRAAVERRGMAAAVGINVNRLFTVAFALGSGLAGLGGALGYQVLPLEPTYPFKYLALFLVVVSIAGLGNIRATAAMALLVGLIDTALRYYFPAAGAFALFAILIAIQFWRYRAAFRIWY
jgi:branched-chain amino acid transport system permease protein